MSALAFFALGAIFGAVYDLTQLFVKLVNSRAFGHIIEFFMTAFCGLLYVCVMIAYCSGEFRAVFLFVTLAAFWLYMISLHRVFERVNSALVKMLKRFFHKILIFFKKVLHFSN